MMNTDSPKMRNVMRAVTNCSRKNGHKLFKKAPFLATDFLASICDDEHWLTWDEECDETGFPGKEESQTRPTGDKLHHSIWATCPLQEGQELLGFGNILKPVTSMITLHSDCNSCVTISLAGSFILLGFQGKGSTYDLTLVSRNCKKMQLNGIFLSNFGKTCMTFLFPDLFFLCINNVFNKFGKRPHHLSPAVLFTSPQILQRKEEEEEV